MSIEKTFGFGNGSPYRSDTFNRNNDLIFGRNGGLEISSVVNAGLNVVVGDIKFIQNGIIVKKVGSSQVTFPTALPAPFYLTATVPDSRPLDNIAWSFVRRPQDIGANTVLLAEWDGSEWRHLPEISIKGLVDHRLSSAIAYQNIGFNTGFRFSPNVAFTEYNILPGQVTDKTGQLVEKLERTPFVSLLADTEYDRIDAIMWRRWMDDTNRIGRLILRPGQTYQGNSLVQNHKTSLGNATSVNHMPKVLNPSDNTMIVMWIENYGDNGVLKFTKYDTDRTTELVAPLDITTNVLDFDAVTDKDDNIMIVYTRGTNIYRMKIDSDGVTTVNFTAIDGLNNPCSKPTIKTDFLGNFYVTFLYKKSPSLHAPYFLKLNTGGTISTSSKLLINASSNYTKVHFDINDDFELFVAYENSSTNEIEYQKLNEIGEQLTSRTVISDDTLYGLVTLSGVARNPIVSVGENNELYITFEQNKGVGNYGLSIYSSEFPARYGHKSVLKDFENDAEDILEHKISLDWGNHGHLLLRTSSKIFFYNFLMPFTASRLLSVFDVNPVASGDFDLLFDRAGSLIQSFTNAQTGSTNNGAPIGTLFFGPETYGTESAFIAEDEVAIPLPSLLALNPVPTYGDVFTITDSAGGNDGAYVINSFRDITINGADYRVTRDYSAVFLPEVGTAAVSQFTKLDGNSIYFCKQTPTIEYNFQEVKAEELDSDILCAAIRKSDNQFLAWYDASLAPLTGAVSRQESFLTSKGNINFDKTTDGGTLTFSENLYIREPFRHNFKMDAGTITGMAENHVAYTRIPESISLLKDGDSDGFGTLNVSDVSQFQIGQLIFVSDSDSTGLEITISNIVDNILYFTASMAQFAMVRGAFAIPSEVVVSVEEQNTGDIKPDSLGYVDTTIYVIAIRANDLVHFRGGTLSLEDGEDGSIGDGPGADTLTFIGSTGDADSKPDYANNFTGANEESLKNRNSNLDIMAEQEARNRNLYDFFPVGTAFTWDAVVGKISWIGEWHLLVPDKGASAGTSHTINTATKEITIGANQIAYIDIDRVTATGDLTPIVVNDNALMLNSGNQQHIVIARRFGDDVSVGLKSQFTLASGQTSGGAPSNKLTGGGVWSWNASSDTVAWTAEANIQIQSLQNSVNKIAAGDSVLDADGKVAYVAINQIAPGGFLAVSVDLIENVANSANNVIIARRIGDNILVAHNLLEDGASVKLDHAFTENVLTMLGLTGNGQTVHNYSSTYLVSQNTSHEEAISALDLRLLQIDTQLSAPAGEYSWLSDGSLDTFAIGTSGHGDTDVTWSPDNSIDDIIIFVDGNKKELHRAGTWPIGDGDTDGEFIKVDSTTIRLKPHLLLGANSGEGRVKITVRPYAAGVTNVVAVKDEGSLISSAVKEFDFVGLSVTASETDPSKIRIEVSASGGSGGGDSYKLFSGTNNTGSTIPAKRAVRFLPNGAIEPCDNAISGKKNPMAITVAEIPSGTTVPESIIVGFHLPGVLASLGFAFNERVFLGSNGELVNEASVPDTASPSDALVQVGEAFGTGTTTTDLIWNKQDYAGF